MTFKNMIMPLGLALIMAPAFSSCLSDGDETIQISRDDEFRYFGNTDIPDDAMAEEAPVVDEGEGSITIPNVGYNLVDEDGTAVVRFDMTGLYDTNNGTWLRLYGTGEPEQNVWVDVDGKPKGVKVYNNDEGNASTSRMVDLVFLVDNSGSMGEEADAIARDISDWSRNLENSGLDIRFGVVGYDGRITGGINLTSAAQITNFLDYSSSTSRTAHWGGVDGASLSSKTGPYNLASMEENGMAALRFADRFYSFRNGANRIYVNFTDEYNEVQGHPEFSVESLKTDWTTQQGTIHTVYSSYKSDSNNQGRSEQPWRMSEYTGGTTLFASSTFTGVTLESLPVTGAMKNSYILRISNIEELIDNQAHKVRITVCDKASIKAMREYMVIFKRQ